jgi:hypothetical protein
MTMRTARWCVLVALAATACNTTSQPPFDGGPQGCLLDTDCPDRVLFYCDTVTAQCLPGCVNREDCSAARRGQYALPECSTDGGGLGCQCDEGRCVVSLCSSDAECGALVCRNGACVAAPASAAIAGCQVVPDLVVLRVGALARFEVRAVDATGAPVVVPQGAIWAAVDGGPLSGSGAGPSAVLVAQAPTADSGAPAAAVQATLGSVSCQASAVVLPASPAAGEVWAVVADELSGRPVTGIDVVLSLDDGSVSSTAQTDGRGLARLALPGGQASYSVTAFGPDHDYLTIARYQGASRYLSLVTRRNQVDRYGGYAGAYTSVPATSNVHLGMAGTSLPGSITSLSFPAILGPGVPTDIKLGTINLPGVAIPAGMTLGQGDSKFKGSYAAQGLAGVCTDDAGVPDEARIAVGACATRAAWSLTGDVPFSQLPLTAIAGGTANLNIPQLLGQLIPAFKLFNSSVARDVAFSLQPTARDDAGQPDFSDQSRFTHLDLDFAQLPLGFIFTAKLPDLPKYRGAYVDGALALGAADVAGRGVVPLGIGAAVNADHDAQTDRYVSTADNQILNPSPGLISLHMAPTHHGLEGAPYLLLVAAMSTASTTDVSAAAGASAIVARLPANQLTFNPDGTVPVDVSGAAFPAYPDGARFNFLDVDQDGIPPRSFRFAATPPDLSGSGLLRVTFSDDLGRRWTVVADASRAADGFRLPKPPSSADRLFAQGLATGTRSSLEVGTQRLQTTPGVDGGAALTFGDVVELGSTNADHTTELLTGFTFLAYGRPTVAFTTPATNPATVTPGSTLGLQVSGFKLGDTAGADGVVRLTFTPATSCPPAILKVETTPGNGALTYPLPGGCTGQETVRAELLKTDQATAVLPPVSASLLLTVQ